MSDIFVNSYEGGAWEYWDAPTAAHPGASTHLPSCCAPTIHPLARLTSSSTYSQSPPFLTLSLTHTHADTQTLIHPLATHQSIRSQRCRPSMSVVGVSPATAASPCQTWESAFFLFCYLFGFWRINGHTLLCGCCVCMQTGVRGHVDAWKRNTTNLILCAIKLL